MFERNTHTLLHACGTICTTDHTKHGAVKVVNGHHQNVFAHFKRLTNILLTLKKTSLFAHFHRLTSMYIIDTEEDGLQACQSS